MCAAVSRSRTRSASSHAFAARSSLRSVMRLSTSGARRSRGIADAGRRGLAEARRPASAGSRAPARARPTAGCRPPTPGSCGRGAGSPRPRRPLFARPARCRTPARGDWSRRAVASARRARRRRPVLAAPARRRRSSRRCASARRSRPAARAFSVSSVSCSPAAKLRDAPATPYRERAAAGHGPVRASRSMMTAVCSSTPSTQASSGSIASITASRRSPM